MDKITFLLEVDIALCLLWLVIYYYRRSNQDKQQQAFALYLFCKRQTPRTIRCGAFFIHAAVLSFCTQKRCGG